MDPPSPRLQINREDLAWAAGFFDGEGHFGLGRMHGRISQAIRASANQTDPRPLERFQAAVLALGSISGPLQVKGHPDWSPRWTWYVQSFANVQAVIALLWTFLSEPKREQALRVLTAYAAKPHHGWPVCKRGHNDWGYTAKWRYCKICTAAQNSLRYHRQHPEARYLSDVRKDLDDAYRQGIGRNNYRS